MKMHTQMVNGGALVILYNKTKK